MKPGTHFAFGTHRDHGLVAAYTPHIPEHLGHWFLERLQYEPVPGEPGLYRLTQPERDGVRRTHQAARALHTQGYTVHLDADVAAAAPAARLARSQSSPDHTSHRPRATAAPSSWAEQAPTAAPRGARRPVPPPAPAPGAGRTR
ncbi:hypothetical protein [Streptomyces sp. NPDC005004]